MNNFYCTREDYIYIYRERERERERGLRNSWLGLESRIINLPWFILYSQDIIDRITN